MTSHQSIVPSDIAVDLSKHGFNEICNHCYCTSAEHNGKSIDEDEECELKAEGRGNEIKYEEHGRLLKMTYTNKYPIGKCVAAPGIEQVIEWLLEKHGIYVEARIVNTPTTPKWFRVVSCVDNTSSHTILFEGHEVFEHWATRRDALLHGLRYVFLKKLLDHTPEIRESICNGCEYKIQIDGKCNWCSCHQKRLSRKITKCKDCKSK